jgi:hypothetical protein
MNPAMLSSAAWRSNIFTGLDRQRRTRQRGNQLRVQQRQTSRSRNRAGESGAGLCEAEAGFPVAVESPPGPAVDREAARRRVAVGHDRLAGILTRMRTGAAEESRRWIMTKRAASGPSLVRFDSPAGREALCDRCAPTHAAAKVAASGHTYWSERRTTRTASPTWRTTSLTVKCSPGLCGRAKGAGQQHSRWSEP